MGQVDKVAVVLPQTLPMLFSREERYVTRLGSPLLVEIVIYQGNSPIAMDNQKLTEIVLNLPHEMGGEIINLRFWLDSNYVLRMTATRASGIVLRSVPIDVPTWENAFTRTGGADRQVRKAGDVPPSAGAPRVGAPRVGAPRLGVSSQCTGSATPRVEATEGPVAGHAPRTDGDRTLKPATFVQSPDRALQAALGHMKQWNWAVALIDLDSVIAARSQLHADAMLHKAICLIELGRLTDAEKAATEAQNYPGARMEIRGKASELLRQIARKWRNRVENERLNYQRTEARRRAQEADELERQRAEARGGAEKDAVEPALPSVSSSGGFFTYQYLKATPPEEIEHVRPDRLAKVLKPLELMNAGDWDGAANELETVLAAEPLHAPALYYKALCLVKLLCIGEAVEAATSARDHAVEDEQTRDEASKLLDQLETCEPYIVDEKAIQRMNAGDFATAKHLLDEVVRRRPGDGHLWFYLAICEARLDMLDDARRSITRAKRNTREPALRAAVKSVKRQILDAVGEKDGGILWRIGRFFRWQ